MIEVGETEEGLNILDFPGFGPIWYDLDFVMGHCEAFGASISLRIFRK